MNLKKLVPILLAFVSVSTIAETRWFEVEVLLFERNVDMNKFSESIPDEHSPVDTSKSIEVLHAQYNKDCVQGENCLHKESPIILNEHTFNKSSQFQRVSESHFKLTKKRKRLHAHSQFQPVFHGAWRMPISSHTVQLPIHIFAGKNFSLDEMKRLKEKQAKLNAEINGDNEEKKPLTEEQIILNSEIVALKDVWAIDGNIKISLNHYLNVNSQLLIRKEITQTKHESTENIEVLSSDNGVEIVKEDEATEIRDQQVTVIKEMLLDQTRRLKSEEVHYFDHPLMGMIIQIRKFELEN